MNSRDRRGRLTNGSGGAILVHAVLVAALILTVSAVHAADSGARFSAISGQVEVRPNADEEGWNFASFETVLNLEDHVRTGEDSTAVLAFPDLSTFALKPDSEIVIATPKEKSSKIRLLAGDLWVNVKKVAEGGSMEVETNQTVAAIKGTTLTFRFVHGVDEIRVVRGRIEIFLKSSGETITAKEGQSVKLLAGGRVEVGTCDPKKVHQQWKKDLEKIADAVELGRVPELLQRNEEAQKNGLRDLQEAQRRLTGIASPTAQDIEAYTKAGERLQSVLVEHRLLLDGLGRRITVALNNPDLPASEREGLVRIRSQITSSQATQATNQAQLDPLVTAGVARGLSSTADAGEADRFVTDMGRVFGDVDALLAEVANNPAGRSQDWFADASQRCSEAGDRLAQYAEETSRLLTMFPQHAGLQALPKRIASYQTRLAAQSRTLTVVTIDASVLTEMTENEEAMAQAIFDMDAQIDAYDAIVPRSPADTQRLQASLRILDRFTRARKEYEKSQRLYNSITRAAAGQKYQTREQLDLETTFTRLSNTFQQLGIVTERLKGRVSELEGQLGPLLR